MYILEAVLFIFTRVKELNHYFYFYYFYSRSIQVSKYPVQVMHSGAFIHSGYLRSARDRRWKSCRYIISQICFSMYSLPQIHNGWKPTQIVQIFIFKARGLQGTYLFIIMLFLRRAIAGGCLACREGLLCLAKRKQL